MIRAKFQNISKHVIQNFYRQLMSQLSSIDLLISRFLGTRPALYLLYLRFSHLKGLSLFSRRTLRGLVVTRTTIQIPSIREPLCPFLHRNPPSTCTKIHGCRSSRSSHCASGSFCGILRRGRRSVGRGDTCPFAPILCLVVCRSLSDPIIPLLTHRHTCRKFLWHIAICKGVLHFFGQPHW